MTGLVAEDNIMSESYKLDYYYGMESMQFQFYRIPKILIQDASFKNISCEAKMAYGLMLDRMSLSAKNGWIDNLNRVFINYKISELMNDLCCGKDKALKILSELESQAGLIERVKKGLGQPSIIYVKNFIRCTTEVQCSDFQNRRMGGMDMRVDKSDSHNTENQIRPILKNRITRVDFSEPNQTNDIYTEENNNQSINQTFYDKMDTMDKDSLERYIKEQIGYENILEDNKTFPSIIVNEMYQLIFDVCYQQAGSVRVNGNDMPIEVVRSRFMKLSKDNVEYVISNILHTTTKIKNIRAYMITALFNSFSSLNTDICQQVNHDIYGGGWKDRKIT